MEGRCLCGAVAFEFQGPATGIELCLCERCRRAYGSAFAATFYVNANDFRWLQGQDMISVYDAPLREKPPAYRHSFCGCCGSPLPIVRADTPTVEVPAGLVQGDFGSRPIRQPWARQAAPWWTADERLPSYDEPPPPDLRAQMIAALEASRTRG
jgi:hypothetical protein